MAESLTKGGFTLTPKTGTGNAKVSISCSERTGRVDTSPVTFTAKMNGFSVSKSVSVVQKGKPEFVTVNNSAVAVDKKGETVTITGVSNTSKLSFSCPDNEVTFSNYTANGASATNGVAIAGDPGASAQYAFSIPVTISANTTESSKRYTMTVTTENEEVATVVFTQVASDFTYDLTLTASPTSIQASGGTTTITGKYKTFRNGVLISTEDVTPTCSIPSGTAFALSGNKVTAPSRGTTAGELRSVTVSASYGNASSTITVSQEANHANYSDVSVSVTPNPVSIPAAGAIYNIKPTASQTASYSSGETKNCSISFSYAAKNTVTGFSNNNATVTVQQNLATSPRNGFIVTVTASGEGSRTASVDVTFNQAAAAAYLNVDPATINIAADATSASFNIESNDSWTIS